MKTNFLLALTLMVAAFPVVASASEPGPHARPQLYHDRSSHVHDHSAHPHH